MPDPTPPRPDLAEVLLARALAAEAELRLARGEIELMRGLVNGMAERIAAQSDLLSRRAEPRLARLAALGDRLLLCAERELVPGAELARKWAEAREGVGGG
jgi:hypothetical protein